MVITPTANPSGVSASSTIATYTGVSIGTAASDRIVVVAVGTELLDSAPTACTIDYGSGDTAMTAASTAATFGNQNSRIFYLAVPVSSTATIKVTFGSVSPNNTQNHIEVYSVTGANFSSASSDTSDDMDATDPVTTGSITIDSGGGFIGVVSCQNDTNGKTWANATEDVDADAGVFRFTTATRTTAGTVTVTCTGVTDTENGAFSWIIFTSKTSLNLNDITANNNDLTNNGAAEVTSLLPLNGANATHSLDLELSSSQHAFVGDTASLSFTGDHTFEAWIKLEQLPSTSGTNFFIMSKDQAEGTTSRGYNFYISTTDKLSVEFFNNDAGTLRTIHVSTAAIVVAGDVGKWVHLSASVDVSVPTIVMYKNAIPVAVTATLSAATSVNNSTANFAIGVRKDTTPDGYFDGLIKDARIWDVIRTQAEISQLFCGELVGNEANLVGNWKFNNNYEDATANNNDLTASGSPTFSTDIPYSGTSTAGADLESGDTDYLYAADSASLSVTGAFTIEGWVKFESLPASNVHASFVSKLDDSTGNTRSYFFALFNNAGTLQLRCIISADGTYAAGNDAKVNWTPTTGVWYHVAVVFDAGNTDILFYVNGIQQGATFGTTASTIFNSTNAVSLGVFGYSGSIDGALDAVIDDFRIWSVARTATEIAHNFGKEMVGNETNLVAYWGFDVTSSNYTSTLTETMTLSDSIIRSISRNLADGTTLTDSIIKSTSRSLTDGLTLTDSIIKGAGKVLADTMTLTDNIIRSIGKVVSESMVLTDSLLKSLSRSLTDTLTLSDTFEKVVTKVVDISKMIINSVQAKIEGFTRSSNKPTGSTRGVDKPRGV